MTDTHDEYATANANLLNLIDETDEDAVAESASSSLTALNNKEAEAGFGELVRQTEDLNFLSSELSSVIDSTSKTPPFTGALGDVADQLAAL